MKCRTYCGACCIVPSISSPIPGLPSGKQAGVRCIHLTKEMKCDIFNKPERPTVCKIFKAEKPICGNSRIEAIKNLAKLENIPYDKLLLND